MRHGDRMKNHVYICAQPRELQPNLKRPGELIREHLATARKPPLNEDEKYLQDVIDKILKI